MLLIRSFLEEKPTGSLENGISLECGKALILRRYRVLGTGTKWRTFRNVVWVRRSQSVDYAGIGVGHIKFFDIRSELFVGPVLRLGSVHGVVYRGLTGSAYFPTRIMYPRQRKGLPTS